ncbi:Hypothetical protein POVR1_LOCUS137 [uncultured virus]|nr:Hypothetical protein POVR1_LOCUS137 [uncultured virus]
MDDSYVENYFNSFPEGNDHDPSTEDSTEIVSFKNSIDETDDIYYYLPAHLLDVIHHRSFTDLETLELPLQDIDIAFDSSFAPMISEEIVSKPIKAQKGRKYKASGPFRLPGGLYCTLRTAFFYLVSQSIGAKIVFRSKPTISIQITDSKSLFRRLETMKILREGYVIRHQFISLVKRWFGYIRMKDLRIGCVLSTSCSKRYHKIIKMLDSLDC